ncbi:MAG: winged helix-turn-helix domain-containing protein [Chlorobiales bacterium]
MLDSLVTSKTRIKLLLKFFLNQETQAYLRGLADEFGESTNAVRVELNRLSEAGFLTVRDDGRTKLYQANTKHSLFPELHSLVKKYLGIDQLIERVLSKLGSVKIAFITGDYAEGRDSGIIDLTIVGNINRNYLNELIEKTERLIHRKIRVLVLNDEEFERLKHRLISGKSLVIWNESQPTTEPLRATA